jgi:hypothetical protein
MLTEEHKSKRMAASRENICRYQDEGEPSMERIVTGYETWVYEFTPELKETPWLGNLFIHPLRINSELNHLQKNNSSLIVGL